MKRLLLCFIQIGLHFCTDMGDWRNMKNQALGEVRLIEVRLVSKFNIHSAIVAFNIHTTYFRCMGLQN